MSKKFPRKKAYIGLFFIIALSSLIGYYSLTKDHYWGGDFSSYLMQAYSILDRDIHTFTHQNEITVEKSSWPVGPTAYPWGLPILLVPVILFFGFNFILLKCINLVAYAFFLFCFYKLLEEKIPRLYNLILVSIFALNPSIILLHNDIMSDLPFLFFSTLSILLIDKTVFRNKSGELKYPVLLGLAIYASFLIRTNGLLLLVTLIICDGIAFFQSMESKKTGKKPVPFDVIQRIIPYGVFLVLYIPLSILLPDGGTSHLSHFNLVSFDTIATNTLLCIRQPANFLTGIPGKKVFYIVLLPFLMVGLWKNLKREYHFLIYSSLTVMLYILWPSTTSYRFLLPVLPLFVYFVFQGIYQVCQLTELKYRKAGYIAAVLFIAVIAFSFPQELTKVTLRNVQNNRRLVSQGPYDNTSTEMFNYIKNKTDSQSTIIFCKPRVMHLMTGRKSIMIDNPSQISRGDYVVICHYNIYGVPPDQIRNDEIKRFVSKGIFNKTYANDKFDVFKIVNNSLTYNTGKNRYAEFTGDSKLRSIN